MNTNIILIWVAIACLLFLGVTADNRSLQRDTELLDSIIRVYEQEI